VKGAEYIVKVLLDGQEYADQWQPRQSDIDWTANMLRALTHGAYWGTSEGIFKVDRQKKELLYAGPKGQIFHRVRKCSELLGWTVRHVSDNPDEKSFSA
jgi:hypothetical protein